MFEGGVINTMLTLHIHTHTHMLIMNGMTLNMSLCMQSLQFPAFWHSQVLVPEFTMKDSVTKIIEGRIYKAVEAQRM